MKILKSTGKTQEKRRDFFSPQAKLETQEKVSVWSPFYFLLSRRNNCNALQEHCTSTHSPQTKLASAEQLSVKHVSNCRLSTVLKSRVAVFKSDVSRAARQTAKINTHTNWADHTEFSFPLIGGKKIMLTKTKCQFFSWFPSASVLFVCKLAGEVGKN